MLTNFKEKLLADVCRKFGLESEYAIAFAYICEVCDNIETLQVTHDVYMQASVMNEDEDE